MYPHFAALSDVRRAQGRKHGIASVLCVILLARLANRHGAVAAARYAKARTQKDPAPIGAGKNPDTGRQEPVSRSTVHRGLQNPDPAWIEEALRRRAQPRLRVGPAIAVDGTRRRGAHRTGEDPYEMVSRIEHGTGMPVPILDDPDEGGEIAAVRAALGTAPVAGRLLTLDALPTPRATARRIVETRGADGRMTVRGHAAETFETFASLHRETTSTGRCRETPTLEQGRIEPRSLEVFTPPAKMIHDPHVQPIFRVVRSVACRKSGTPTTEHACGRISVAADRASPQPVRAGNRGPRGVESSHPLRDAPFREDDSRLRARNAPANHAILHTLAIAVILHHQRKLPQPFPSFADARHPDADQEDPMLVAVMQSESRSRRGSTRSSLRL